MAKPKDGTEGAKDRHGIPVEKWGDEPVNLTEEDRRRLWSKEALMREERWVDQLRADTRKRLGIA